MGRRALGGAGHGAAAPTQRAKELSCPMRRPRGAIPVRSAGSHRSQRLVFRSTDDTGEQGHAGRCGRLAGKGGLGPPRRPGPYALSSTLRIDPLIDITFCNRELYGLMAHNELVKFKIGANRNGGLVVTGDAHWTQVQGCGVPSSNKSYIVELQGKMALVATNTHGQHPMFKLFELSGEEMALYTYKWAEVISLGDYALFLGRAFSKAVYVPSGGHGAVRRNYIYTDHVVYVMTTNAYGGRAFQMQDQGNDIHMIKVACGLSLQISN
ncbi:hypothetical protein ACQ4PT_005179 [Festuca glaucescens]